MGIPWFQLRQFAIAAAASLLVLSMSVGSAWAVPPSPGSISGMRTLADGSIDTNNNGLSPYKLIAPGTWQLQNSGSTITYFFDGTYLISGLSPGTYRVGVRETNQGPVGYPQAFYGGGDSLETAASLVVTSGGETANIDIQRGTAQTLTVDAAEPDNRPKHAKTLTPSTEWAEHTLCELPDIDWYKFDAVAGHTYSIETSPSLTFPVWSSRKTSLSDTFMMLLDSNASTGIAFDDDSNGRFARIVWTAPSTRSYYVRVTSNTEGLEGYPTHGAYTINLADQGLIAGTGTLAGSVLDADKSNAPVKGAYVTLTNEGTSATFGVMTAADGTYSVSGLAPGDYQVRADSVGYDTTSTTTAATVSAGATVSQILHVSAPADPDNGLVQGVVHLTGGGLATETTATLVGPASYFVETALSPTGTFYFEDLAPGVYSLTIRKAGYRVATEQSIVVGAGNGSWSGPTFIETLVPAGTVAGTVCDGGTPLAGVTVSVAGAGTAVTAANGTYAISEVETGSASVTFLKAGYAPLTKPVEVSMGATSPLDASLARLKTPCSITRSPASATLTYKRKKGSAKFTLTATVKGQYWTFAGTSVALQSSANGKNGWKTVAALKTSAAGAASKTLTIKRASTRYYRWYTANSATHSAAYSTTFKVRVK